MSKRRATSAPADAITAARRLALAQLLDAHDVAHDTGRDPWAYACQLQDLHDQRVSDTALRWLVDQQLADHRLETTQPTSRRRTFKPSANGHFTPASCFSLTKAGVVMAQLTREEEDRRQRTEDRSQKKKANRNAAQRKLAAASLPPHSLVPHPSPLAPPDVPHYDADRRTLFFRGKIVKQFLQPAANQELILTAFEEENWPPRIDDPLPPALEIDPKKRLSDAVFRLNKRQKKRVILFQGDGTGQGVKWRESGGRGA